MRRWRVAYIATTLLHLYSLRGYGTHTCTAVVIEFSSKRWVDFFMFFFFCSFQSIFKRHGRLMFGCKILFDPVKFIHAYYTRSLEHRRKIQWPRVFLLTYQCWCLKTFKYYTVMNSTKKKKKEYSPFTFTLHFTIVIDLTENVGKIGQGWTILWP